MNKFVLGYFILGVAAIPVTLVWSLVLHWLVKRSSSGETLADRIWWIPIVVGIVERIVITTLVGANVSGTAGFLGAWIAVKAAGGWSRWSQGTKYGRAVFFVGLLGSALSLLFGLFGGLIIAGP